MKIIPQHKKQSAVRERGLYSMLTRFQLLNAIMEQQQPPLHTVETGDLSRYHSNKPLSIVLYLFRKTRRDINAITTWRSSC